MTSDAYRNYFDKGLPQPDRSVITFRKIVNHDDGCPERIASNVAQEEASRTRRAEPQPLSRPPPADMPPVGLEAVKQGLPRCHQGRAASPEDVRETAALEQQVKDAEECIQKLRKTLDAIDDRKREKELSTQIKGCARIQNIAACSLEVASPLYLIFNMIIPVM